jgi:voltage-gated potassium channel
MGFWLLIIITAVMVGIYIFESKNEDANVKSLWDSFWYTIVTLTTVGYGDISPQGFWGRIIGLIAMIVGVAFVAAITGKTASFLVDQQLKKGKGLLKLKHLQNHFIICGWKNDFEKIIDGILETNPDYDVSDLVLINNAPTEYMQFFMDKPKYKLLNYIHGDYIDETVLMKAKIKSAKRILILADNTGEYNPMEIDSRTVMSVMTVSKLNRHIYTVAELLEEKFEKYLTMAHCDEIVLSKQYERSLIVNASSGTGVSHVVRDLLSVETHESISIVDMPNSFVGISFKNAFEYFSSKKQSILIGVLENTGNFYARKKEALSEAQKTPDISKIVENLLKVKDLKANSPVLNPGFDYTIKENSMAIIVGQIK